MGPNCLIFVAMKLIEMLQIVQSSGQTFLGLVHTNATSLPGFLLKTN